MIVDIMHVTVVNVYYTFLSLPVIVSQICVMDRGLI